MALVSLEPSSEDIASAMDTRTLKPCPFCGRWAHPAGYQNDETKIYVFKVICTGCTASTFSSSRDRSDARSRAVEAWQARTPQEPRP